MTLTNIIPAFVGGLLIGLGAAVLLLLNKKIAGISGIFDEALHGAFGEAGWRAAFIAGLVLPALFMGAAAQVEFSETLPAMAGAGLLVGFGTRLGSGCTSGHGVCGIARLSPRSLVATATFMTTAMITVAASRLAGSL